MDCYSCKHRRDLPGSCHSACSVVGEPEIISMAILISGRTEFEQISLVPHGVVSGWCMWPANFDPIWVKHCNFYEGKS